MTATTGGTRRRLAFIGSCLAVALGAVLVVGMTTVAAPRSLADRVQEVASGLRCPVCQGLTVADSPSGLAREMRRTIGRELLAGEPPERIRAGFASSYGEWILLDPPKRGLDLIVWGLPALLLSGGLVAVATIARRWSIDGPSQPAMPEDRIGEPR